VLEDGNDGVDVNPSISQALTMASCGAALASFDGTTAYSNGANTGTGYSCAGVGTYGYQYQCVELAMRHFSKKWGLHWYGNAKDLLNTAPRDKVSVYSNGDAAHPPVPGDMVVWTNGAYGHVAVVSAVRSGAVDVIEQNVKGDGAATLSYDGASIGARWGTWIPAGWAHAKANGNTPPPPPPGVNWSCSNSAYAGQQYWTCSSGALYECQSGTAVKQDCGHGCISRPTGTNDLCISNTSGWSCSGSAYAGKQYWTCSGGKIYRCDGTTPTVVACPNGCVVHALGTDDACK
jgi:surface antigen